MKPTGSSVYEFIPAPLFTLSTTQLTCHAVTLAKEDGSKVSTANSTATGATRVGEELYVTHV